jgi:hypothetical protein
LANVTRTIEALLGSDQGLAAGAARPVGTAFAAKCLTVADEPVRGTTIEAHSTGRAPQIDSHFSILMIFVDHVSSNPSKA